MFCLDSAKLRTGKEQGKRRHGRRWQVSACFDVVVIYERRTGTFSSASLPTRFSALAENSLSVLRISAVPDDINDRRRATSTAFES